MDNKEKIIDFFAKTIEQNKWLKKYISVEEACYVLNENVVEVRENYEMPQINVNAFYSYMDKLICFSKKVDIQNMTTDDKEVIIHELLHALTRNIEFNNDEVGEGFIGIHFVKQFERRVLFRNYIDFYEKRMGLSEGITQLLAERLIEKKESVNKFSAYDIIGINISESGSYALEKILVKELAILYGEDTIIRAYLTNDINIIKNAIANNSKIENPDKTFEDFSDLADSLVEMDSSIDIRKENRKQTRDMFSTTQDFFVKEILTKEIEVALESYDIVKIEEIKVKIEKLLELDIDIRGKGNPFNDIVKKFNEHVQSMGMNLQIPMKQEKFLDKIKKSFSKGNVADKILCVTEVIGDFINKHRKTQLAMPVAVAKKTLKPVAPKKDMIEEIRGLPNEEYEKACKDAENDWEERVDGKEIDGKSSGVENKPAAELDLF